MKETLFTICYMVAAGLGVVLLFFGAILAIDVFQSPGASIEIVGEDNLISVGDYTTIPSGKEVTFICTRGGQFVKGDWISSGDISVNLTKVIISEKVQANAITVIPTKKDGTATLSFLQKNSGRQWMKVAYLNIRTV